MQKLIDLLRERKPNFDENHILDYMYSQWTIFIKDWKPVYAYDEDIFPNTELMIISKKEWFISRLVEKNKIDREMIETVWKFVKQREIDDIWLTLYSDYQSLLMYLSIQDKPIEFLLSILK